MRPQPRAQAFLDGDALRNVYDGDGVLEERDGDDNLLARYTTEDSSYYGPWLHMQRGTASRFPVYDGVGSMRALLDQNGAVNARLTIDAFGKHGAWAGTSTPYQFGAAWGYLTDPSGLQQLGARFYWPEVGRFVQQDPIGDGMNWYAYVGNNPVRHLDPEGTDYGTIGGMLGPLGLGAQFGNPDPCITLPQPPWWDIFHLTRIPYYVHPYFQLGLAAMGGVTYSPDWPRPQYPRRGWSLTGSAGFVLGGSGSIGVQGQGNSYGVGGVLGVSGGFQYVLW